MLNEWVHAIVCIHCLVDSNPTSTRQISMMPNALRTIPQTGQLSIWQRRPNHCFQMVVQLHHLDNQILQLLQVFCKRSRTSVALASPLRLSPYLLLSPPPLFIRHQHHLKYFYLTVIPTWAFLMLRNMNLRSKTKPMDPIFCIKLHWVHWRILESHLGMQFS